MAAIRTRKNKDGSISYRAEIRKKKHQILKTFTTEEDAKLYVFHKERLINLIENFEIPIEKRITLESIFEMKIDALREANVNQYLDIEKAAKRFLNFFDGKIFYDQISFDDWLDCAKKLSEEDVYRGAKNEWNKRKMSLATLRNIFACISSSISYAQGKGINLENFPLKVLKTYINPKLKLSKSKG